VALLLAPGREGRAPVSSECLPNSGAIPDRVTLAEVLSSFTLRGTGSFHFRFQQDVDGQPMFVDVVDPAEAVPRVGGNIVARVLRLGESMVEVCLRSPPLPLTASSTLQIMSSALRAIVTN